MSRICFPPLGQFVWGAKTTQTIFGVVYLWYEHDPASIPPSYLVYVVCMLIKTLILHFFYTQRGAKLCNQCVCFWSPFGILWAYFHLVYSPGDYLCSKQIPNFPMIDVFQSCPHKNIYQFLSIFHLEFLQKHIQLMAWACLKFCLCESKPKGKKIFTDWDHGQKNFKGCNTLKVNHLASMNIWSEIFRLKKKKADLNMLLKKQKNKNAVQLIGHWISKSKQSNLIMWEWLQMLLKYYSL